MLEEQKRSQIAEQIRDHAVSKYGDPTRRKIRPPLDQLVQSILWRYTSVRRGTRGLRQLKRSFVDWNEVRVSPAVEVAAAMASTEWARVAAEHLEKVLTGLFDLRNEVELEFLRELTTAQARAFLQSLHEVPRDLADEVLLFSLGAEVIPLNANAARMCYRLGLIPSDRTILKNQKELMKLWEPEDYVAVAEFFHDYAWSVCTPEEPQHAECPLEELCPRVGL